MIKDIGTNTLQDFLKNPMIGMFLNDSVLNGIYAKMNDSIKEYINENFSRPSILKENDGDDMGVYKELDDKVFDICYRHGFNVQTRVGDDLAYYAFFIADDRQPKVQEAIQLLEKLGLRKINNGTLSGTIHYYTIDFH